MKKVIVAKFGGGALGVDGKNIPVIVERVGEIRRLCDVGPVVVVSAPKTVYKEKTRSLTDVALDIGESYADFDPIPSDPLFIPYVKMMNTFLGEEYKSGFEEELYMYREKVKHSLNQALENRRFVDVNRARVLAYGGEVLMCALMDYILKSSGFDAYHPRIEDWPIVTDSDFENANISFHLSRQRIEGLIDELEAGRVVCIGGFVGVTEDGLETTFERGGSDRTAVDLAILLADRYNVTLDFEKDEAVLSADPDFVKNNLQSIWSLSYNEAALAGRFGVKIIDPIAIRDLQESELDITVLVTDTNNPKRFTKIQRNPTDRDRDAVKIVTGKKDCAILELDKAKRMSFEDYLKIVKRYQEFLELRPYQKGRNEFARFLFLDGSYVRRYEKELKSFSENTQIRYGLGAITLVGDKMAFQPGIAARAFNAVFEDGINIVDGSIQGPTSSILIIVEDEDLEGAVVAIHSKRNEAR